ncbi:MAG: phosphatase PAP2 family protein [Ginsengibacter sp.]
MKIKDMSSHYFSKMIETYIIGILIVITKTMKKIFRLIVPFFFFLIPTHSIAQDSLFNKLDSLQKKKDKVGQTNTIRESAYNETTNLTFNSYFVLLGSNLKQEFTKPFHMTGKDWKNFGIFTGGIIAVSFADEPIQKAALKLRERNTGINGVSKFITNFGGLYEVGTLVGLGAYGFIFKNEKLKTTTLLATQSYITAAALETVLKFVSGRTRPSFYSANEEAEPRFTGPFSKTARDLNGKKVYSSFPSGHTTVAFAAATVFASEYRNTVAVPIIAYTAASLIGISRITENKHWTTDVLVGAAIGFLSGKQVVNNYHRYAKIKNAEKKKNQLTFTMNYSYGHLQPGMVLHFR